MSVQSGFVLAARVVLDDVARGLDDRLGRAVILLEFDRVHALLARVVLLELQDVADVRAAPLVDGLVLVADHADVAVAAVLGVSEHRKQQILAAVGILILVDVNVTENRRWYLVPDVLVVAQQAISHADDLTKIERVVREHVFLILFVNPFDLLAEDVVRGHLHPMRAVGFERIALGGVDRGLDALGTEGLLVDVERFVERGLDQRQLIRSRRRSRKVS